jgi:NAD(P)-dependent dehydrogenase (short-subunit alcohol dehydrogenase family)
MSTQNVGDDQSVRDAATELSQRLGNEKLYAIVNNAGTGVAHNTLPPEILNTNTRGPRRVVDSFLPLLNKTGRIVNVGSGGGPGHVNRIQADDSNWKRFCYPMNHDEIEKEINIIEAQNDSSVAYRASKALLACYTMALAKQYPGLMISIITPGELEICGLPCVGEVKSKCIL